jgi:preprotein translocase subunit SecE
MKDFFIKIKDKVLHIVDFLRDTRKELKNVSWPGRREVTGTTLVVIAAVFFFGFYLYVVDYIVQFGMNHILRAFSAQQ